jgi:hypothetical protein
MMIHNVRGAVRNEKTLPTVRAAFIVERARGSSKH